MGILQVSNGDGGRPVKQTPNVTDGEWHMLTLTTPAGGGKGYKMYIDGGLVAEMSPGGGPYVGNAPASNPLQKTFWECFASCKSPTTWVGCRDRYTSLLI